MSWVIRDYQASDLCGCLDVMRSNTPPFFATHELDEFVEDIQQREILSVSKRWPYFVLATGTVVRACGGYVVNDQGIATLIWGMVHASEHRKGLGRALFNYRLLHLKSRAKQIDLDTTPASFGFYQRMGFQTQDVIPNGYAPGLDKVIARLIL